MWRVIYNLRPDFIDACRKVVAEIRAKAALKVDARKNLCAFNSEILAQLSKVKFPLMCKCPLLLLILVPYIAKKEAKLRRTIFLNTKKRKYPEAVGDRYAIELKI